MDKETGEIFIETTLEDIAEANELMKNILLKKSDELGYATRKFLENVKQYLQSSGLKSFTNKQIRTALKENPSSQKKHMVELQQYGYVKKQEGDKKKGFIYEIVNMQEYNQLQHIINTTLDNILQVASGSPVVQSGSEPLKAATIKKRKQVVQ